MAGTVIIFTTAAIIALACCKAAGQADRKAEKIMKERDKYGT